MFQSIQVDEIFDLSNAQASKIILHTGWRSCAKPTGSTCLKFVDVKLPAKTKKQTLAEAALQHFEFVSL